MSGAPAATTIWLSRDTPINYSDGTMDTLPANTPAVLPDTTTAFDRTHDVYVPYTVQGSGVLSIIKESLLPTLTSAYAPLARVELHAIKPYQPEPYLASGGVGGGAPLTTTVVSDTSARVLDLGTGGSAPAGWETLAFDDSAWAAALVEPSPPIGAALGASTWVGTAPGTAAGTDRWLLRRRVVLPAGALSAASLQFWADNYIDSIWLNGTDITSASGVPGGGWFGGGGAVPVTTAVALGLLLPGAANVLAIQVRNASAAGYNPTSLDFVLQVTGPGTGGVPDPGGHEGDLLYYHSGAWVTLPIGTSGQELTVVTGDPAWTDQPADVDTSGTVTSVAFSGPTGTTTGGSPITTSGAISLAWAPQSANVMLASPNGSSGVPTFRALVGADIPVDASTIVVGSGVIKGNYQAGSGVSISGNTISATGSGGSVTSVALALPGLFTISGSPVTTSGTLTATLAAQSAHTVLAGPASGSAAAPTFRALQGSDLPAAAGAGGKIHAHGHFL